MSSIDFNILNKTIVLCAKRNSGKSQLLRYILLKNKHLFNKVFCICPTESINRFYCDVISKENIFDEYKEDWIKQLMNKLGDINQGKADKDAYHVLLILDDIAADHNLHASQTFRQLFTKGRHYKITLLITAQYLYMIGPVARNNADYVCVGQLNTQGLEILSSEFLSGNITKQDFIKMYYRCTNDYKFLLINNNSTKSNDDINSFYGVLKVPPEFVKK